MSAITGVRREMRSNSSIASGTPKACAVARRCSTALVDPPVAITPVIAFSKLRFVTMSRGARPAFTSSTASLPHSNAASPLLASMAGMLFGPSTGNAEHFVGGRHRVRRELTAAGARARKGVILDVLKFLGRNTAGIVGAKRLVDVLDGQFAIPEQTVVMHASSRRDRAAVEQKTRSIHASHRDGHRRNGLVAAGDGDEPVEHVAARDKFDGVGDDLAADERGLHSLRARCDAVVDGDRVDFERCATRRGYTLGDAGREVAVRQVTWHRTDPAMRNTDLRAR